MSVQNESLTESSDDRPGFYQHDSAHVRVADTVGLVFMSILSIMLLVSLLRSEKRYRDLLARLAGTQPL